jgi:rhodanese-related sulfurtransferase
VETLKAKGFKQAAALLGGYMLWAQEGRPVEKIQK